MSNYIERDHHRWSERGGAQERAVITTDIIFRQLIMDEIRNDRLSRWRRRRIVRYAARLGLSAVEAGRLVAECRAELLHSDDPKDREKALRVIVPEPRERRNRNSGRALAIALLIIVDAALLVWLMS